MKVYINYADEKFKEKQKFSLKMASLFGKFDNIIGYQKKDIDNEFWNKYKHILEQKKGGGYWLWKPYFIDKTLESLKYGDYLFYSDAGPFMIKKIDWLINELNIVNQDIMGYELPFIESQWTKRELLINMNCEDKKFTDSNQILATFILVKKTEFSLLFFKKFLEIASNEINLTDKFDNKISQNSDFIEHRHDQSIFSLLYKKHNLQPFKDASQYGSSLTYRYGYSLKQTTQASFKNKKKFFFEFGTLYLKPGQYGKMNILKFRHNKFNNYYSCVIIVRQKKSMILQIIYRVIKSYKIIRL